MARGDEISERSVEAKFLVRQITEQLYSGNPDITELIKMRIKVGQLLAELIDIAKKERKVKKIK